MFRKMLAIFGVGAVHIETKLVAACLTAGDVISGIIEIKGGHTTQQIQTIFVSLYTSYIGEGNSRNRMERALIKSFKVCDAFEIKAGEEHSESFYFNLPLNSPITAGHTLVWVETEAEIKRAFHPRNKQYIEVLPSYLVNEVLKALEQLGFLRYNADCEVAPPSMRTPMAFIQQFEYRPSKSIFREQIEELELTFLNQSENHVEVLFEIDRRAKSNEDLFTETLEKEDSHEVLIFTKENIVEAKAQIIKMIEQNTE